MAKVKWSIIRNIHPLTFFIESYSLRNKFFATNHTTKKEKDLVKVTVSVLFETFVQETRSTRRNSCILYFC